MPRHAAGARGCPALGANRQVGKRGVIMAQAINDGLIRGNHTCKRTRNAPGADVPLGRGVPGRPVPRDSQPAAVRSSKCTGWPARPDRRRMRELLAARAAGAGTAWSASPSTTATPTSSAGRPAAARTGRRHGVRHAGRLGGENAWDQEGPRKPLMDAPDKSAPRPGRHRDRLARPAPCPAARRRGRPGRGDRRQPPQPAGDHRQAGQRVLLPLRRARRRCGSPVRETGYDYGCAIWASAHTSRTRCPGPTSVRRIPRPGCGPSGLAPAGLDAPAGRKKQPDGLISLTLRRVPTPLE